MLFLQPGCWRQLPTSLAPVGVLVDHGEVVIDLAVLRTGQHLPAPHADGPDGVLVLHHPGAGVEHVDVLLDVEVAGEPGEVVPVPHLVSHLGPVGLPGLVPAAATVVVGEQGNDLADRPVVDAAYGLAEGVAVAETEARDDREALRLRHLAALQDRVNARGIDGDRLLGEDVLARLHGRAEVNRPELRRRGEQYHVDTAVEKLLAGVEPHEPVLGADVDLAADLRVLLEDRQALLEPVLEGVGHRDELDVRVGRSACVAAPVPRPPQPTRPTRSTSLPAACTCGKAASVPAMAAVVRNSRREDPGDMWALRLKTIPSKLAERCCESTTIVTGLVSITNATTEAVDARPGESQPASPAPRVPPTLLQSCDNCSAPYRPYHECGRGEIVARKRRASAMNGRWLAL